MEKRETNAYWRAIYIMINAMKKNNGDKEKNSHVGIAGRPASLKSNK